MRIPKLTFRLALLLIITGCAHYQAQPITLAELSFAQGKRTLAAGCSTAANADAPTFAKLDYSEAELVAAAECFNPELARAKAATQLASANGELARRYPGLALVVSAEYARKAPESSKWLRGFSLDLPLDFGARKAVRIEAAMQAQALSTIEIALAKRALAGKVAASVAAINAAINEQALLQTRAQQAQVWLKFVDQRILEGQAARPERLKPQQELLLTQAALLRAQTSERIARSELAQALGVPLAQVLNLRLQAARSVSALNSAATLNLLPKQDSANRQAALLARPELLRALGQYQLAELALRLEFAKQYPELHLAPGYIWERGLVKLPLALSALLPPLDGNRSAIAVALAARTLAARELELVQANISAEIDLAFANRDAALSALTLGSQQIELAKTELGSAQAAFEAGELDQLGRLSAQFHLNDQLLAAHALQVQLQLAERALAQALAIAPSAESAASHPEEKN